MTHVEVDSKGKWTLFDYKRRDPLTKDAKTYRILERKEEENWTEFRHHLAALVGEEK